MTLPLKKDDVRIVINWIICDIMGDNKMKPIRIVHFITSLLGKSYKKNFLIDFVITFRYYIIIISR
jgi:hypothetical protein